MIGEQAPPRQLPLSLPHRPAMGRADFLTGAANYEAIALVDRWPDWPVRVVYLHGPAGAGKSHLAEIWRSVSGATTVSAAALARADADRLLVDGAAIVEDLHLGPFDEAALFHLLNLAGERNAALLLTSRLPPSAMQVDLPDLVSRLRAAQPVRLAEPDDYLLRHVLIKLFADRQLSVAPAVIDYIVTRLDRSLEAANLIVDKLDRQALAEGRAVTRHLAGVAFGEGFEVSGDDDQD
jgi:chromosomal replication initiation ATPase DnaA